MKTLIVLFAVLLLGHTAESYNLLSDPGFEGDAPSEDWAFYGNAAVEDWFRPPQGANAIYLKGEWAGRGVDQGVYQSTDPGIVIPGTEYDVTASFYKNDGWTAADPLMKIEFLDEYNQILGSSSTNLAYLPMDQWDTHSIRATAPENTSVARVSFTATQAGECGSLGADHFVLQVIPEPTTLAFVVFMGTAGIFWMRRRKQV